MKPTTARLWQGLDRTLNGSSVRGFVRPATAIAASVGCSNFTLDTRHSYMPEQAIFMT